MRIATRFVLPAIILGVVAVWTPVILDWRDGARDETPAGRPDPSEAGDSDHEGQNGRGRLRILPTLAQAGNVPAKADAAAGLMIARFAPARKGALVLLEERHGSGWRVVDHAPQDRRGTAVFTQVRPPRRDDAVFRATPLKADGSRGTSTNSMRANRWKLIFGDQFDGATLDSSRWSHRLVGVYNPEGSRICSKSDPRAVSVSGGTLRLQAMKDPERLGEPCPTPKQGNLDYYLNGHVATEGIFDFTHGVAAARIKFPQGRGQHGSFWMQKVGGITPIPGNPAKSGAEIDIVEFFGEGYPGGGLASFLYYLDRSNASKKVGGVWPKATNALPPGDAWWRSYHVFSVEWTKKGYVFRVDGRETFRTKEGVSGVGQFLVLSLLTSDWELPQLDQATLPSTMEVDWVRVWQPQPMKPDAG